MAKSKSKVAKRDVPSGSIKSSDIIIHTTGRFFQPNFFRNYWKEMSILFVASFAMYYLCLPYKYILDDLLVVTGNSFTKQGFGGIWDILTTESFEGYFGAKRDLVQGNRYRPLSIITFAIEYGIVGGTNAWLSHFINILLYSFTGISIMMVLDMMFRNFKKLNWWMSIPFLASLIFVVHPIHTEAVANIKGRDEIMAMLFSMLTLYFSLRYMDDNTKKWLSATLISYLLALLSKENAITFLAVIPLTVYFFSNTDWPRLKTLLFWLMVATGAYLMLRFSTAGVPKFGQEINDLMNNPFLGMNPIDKLGTIMYTLGKYLLLLIWPHPLTHDYYPYAIPKSNLFSIIPFISLSLYAGLLYIGFKGIKSKSIVSYSILFYITTLSIVSNIVINLGTFMNERFIFMASLGFCILVAYALSDYLPSKFSRGKEISIVIALSLVLGFAVKSYVRVPVWKDEIALNGAAVAVSPNSARANSFLSTAYFEKYRVVKNLDEQKRLLGAAEKYAKKSLEIYPDYQNANLMLIGVAAEKYKMTNDINDYVSVVLPCVLQRPEIPFIKEFGDYLKGKHNEQLFPFYLKIGTELLKFNDRRRDYSAEYLKYAYDIQPASKEVNEALAKAYELTGNIQESQRFKAAAQSLR